jgi:hypothetical protein
MTESTEKRASDAAARREGSLRDDVLTELCERVESRGSKSE